MTANHSRRHTASQKIQPQHQQHRHNQPHRLSITKEGTVAGTAPVYSANEQSIRNTIIQQPQRLDVK
jgi:hypothetical protein